MESHPWRKETNEFSLRTLKFCFQILPGMINGKVLGNVHPPQFVVRPSYWVLLTTNLQEAAVVRNRSERRGSFGGFRSSVMVFVLRQLTFPDWLFLSKGHIFNSLKYLLNCPDFPFPRLWGRKKKKKSVYCVKLFSRASFHLFSGKNEINVLY